MDLVNPINPYSKHIGINTIKMEEDINNFQEEPKRNWLKIIGVIVIILILILAAGFIVNKTLSNKSGSSNSEPSTNSGIQTETNAVPTSTGASSEEKPPRPPE